MSLDVTLYRGYHISYDGGKTLEAREEIVFDANITHNLREMADKAGIYKCCWAPEDIGATKAKDIISLLENGYNKLKENPEFFNKFNPPNGWGTYKVFVLWVKEYLDACKLYPDAMIVASR